MSQIVNTKLKAIARMPFENIESGLIRTDDGAIYFAMPWGQWTVPYPVEQDGRLIETVNIGTAARLLLYRKHVDVIDRKDLGVELRHANGTPVFKATAG